MEQGYVVATFSVRGTGASGGCFGLGDANEQRDQNALVEWLAAQDWSNERVGMGGKSYLSWTAWQAAVHAPPALKTVVTAGEFIDWYQMRLTPQGARSSLWSVGLDAYMAEWSVGNGEGSGSADWVGRLCPDAIVTHATRTASDSLASFATAATTRRGA